MNGTRFSVLPNDTEVEPILVLENKVDQEEKMLSKPNIYQPTQKGKKSQQVKYSNSAVRRKT